MRSPTYGFGIRSERRLCEEVHLNLAYRWFCRLGLDGDVPDHSTFSKNRHGRFRESDLLPSCSRLFFAQDCGLNHGFTDNSDDWRVVVGRVSSEAQFSLLKRPV
jgi:hypothetical protein